MPYLSKLTKRLAAGRWFLALLPLLAACTLTEGFEPDSAAPEVAEVRVLPESSDVVVGSTLQLTAQPRNSNGQNLQGESITWTSSDTEVATVDATGTVTLLSTGSVDITASARGKRGKGHLNVTPVPVASIVVNPMPLTLQVGQSGALSASTYSSDGTILTGRSITWSSSNTAAATVNQNGVVSGVAAGSATITGTSENVSGTTTVSVSITPVASVVLNPTSLALQVGQSNSINATTLSSAGTVLAGRTVTWQSSNTAVATVSSAGSVTAVAVGSTSVTALSEGVSSSATAITVTAAPVPNPGTVGNLSVPSTTDTTANITFTDAGNGIGGGASYIVRYEAGTSITWATATNVVRGTCVSPVNAPSAGATVTCQIRGLAASSGYRMEVMAYRGTIGVDAVYGAPSNIAAATTAAAPPLVVAAVTALPSSASITVGATRSFAASATTSTGAAVTDRTVTWTSTNTAVATVNASGVATGVAAGTTTIRATIDGISSNATLTVTSVVQVPGTWSNQPAGFVQLASWKNEATLLPAAREWWSESNPSWFNGGYHERVTSGYSGQPSMGGPAVVHWHIDAGAPGGGGAGRLMTDVSSRSPQEFFVGWEHQFPSNYPSSDNLGGNKMLFVHYGGGRIYLVYDAVNFGGRWVVALEGFTFTESNVSSQTPVFGAWAKLELYMKANTGPNGIVRLWQNGVLILEMTHVTFPPGGATQFYDEGTNNGIHYPLQTSSRVVGPGALDRWTSALHMSVPPT